MSMGNWSRRAVLCGLAGSIILSGCAGGTAAGGGPPPPSITIKSTSVYYPGNTFLSGTYAIAGQGAFTLLVNGIGFTSSSVVNWNGNPLPTQFGTATDIAASVSSSLIVAPGKATVTVSDSRATSNAVVLPIASSADATAGVVALITVATDGSPANGDSLVAPSISATGRYVAFQSNATNLASGPGSGYQEIYERDTCVGAPSGCTPNTIRITVTSDGSPVNGHSRESAISSDGRFVAFDTSATNILQNSGDCSPSAGLACVFLRDTCIGAASGCVPQTVPISVDMTGAIVRGGSPAVTPDGRFVIFGSPAPSVAVGETNGIGDIFVRDTCSGTPRGCTPVTTVVSESSTGTPRDAHSGPSAVSGTGRYVAFQSWATNLVPNETAVPGMFWRDTCIGASTSCTPATIRADLTTSGSQPNNNVFNNTVPAITLDGRLVAFGSTATNLVSTDVQGQGNVYIHDTCTGVLAGCTPSTSLVSFANDGSVANCGSPGNQGGVSISADGRFVAFASIATNLTPDDNFPACGWEDIFVRDTCLGVTSGCFPSTVRVSVANKPNPGISANAISVGNAMSADGHYVAFISSATNLLSPPSNGHAMVYLAKTGF